MRDAALKKPPFLLQEQGWGEFDMNLVLHAMLTATGIGKGRMQLVGDTVKDRGGHFITVRVQHHHLDGPFAHGVALGGMRNIGSVVQAQMHHPHQHVHRVVVRQRRSCNVERGGAAELVGEGGKGGSGGRGRWDEKNAGSEHCDGDCDGDDR